MHSISRHVTRKDHADKVAGRARFTCDLPMDGVLHVAFVRAALADAAIEAIEYPPLPEGYWAADARDVPVNVADPVQGDMPVFAWARARYVGEAVAAIAGPDPAVARELAGRTLLYYGEAGAPTTALEDATDIYFERRMDRGDVDAAFAGAEQIIEETFLTGRQDQAYLETQAMQARLEGDTLVAEGGMESPFRVLEALRGAFGLTGDQARARQLPTGGAFGGKEEDAARLACQVAALARKSGKPCRAVLDRQEDMISTTKRHPSRSHLRAAIREGRITGLDCDLTLDGGAYRGLSEQVLIRCMAGLAGVYAIDSLRVRGRVMGTHTPPSGLHRGSGGPQAFFAIEIFLEHIARRLGEDALTLKTAHLARKGDRTATGGLYREDVPLPEMVERALEISHYTQKRGYFLGDSGRYRRGIGLAMVYQGCGLEGDGEDLAQARVRLAKDAGGTVRIHASIAETGQGVSTAFPKIVAETLGIPLERVTYDLPDTALTPDSGPTAASRSIVIVGRLLERAARTLKETWREGEAQEAEARWTPSGNGFDPQTLTGDLFPSLSWAVNVVEVEVDTYTGVALLRGVWGVLDCGTPIDLTLLQGQADGGIVQGLGFAAMERMEADGAGNLLQSTFAGYLLPTAPDIPSIHVEFYEDPSREGPFGARGAGELTCVAAAPAFAAAVENALGIQVQALPLTPEDILERFGS